MTKQISTIAKLDSKGQIFLGKDMMDNLNIKPGSMVKMVLKDRELILKFAKR